MQSLLPFDQDDLDTAHEIIEWYQEHLEEKEPHAVNTIRAFSEVSNALPYDINELIQSVKE
jgi:hypothetical protein